MSEATVREAIKSTILAIDGISLVHDYIRWAKSWGDFLDMFKTEGNIINGWMFGRQKTTTRQRTLGEIELAHVFMIHGYYGLDDSAASEKTFQAQAEDMQDAFFADETLGGVCDTTRPDFGPMNGAVGFQIDIVEPRLFGNVLCHYCQGRLCAVESVSD